MKVLLFLWAFPMALFWGWYFLSLNDISFGYAVLTRDLNEAIFALYAALYDEVIRQAYGEVVVTDPATIPMAIAKACVIDTLLVGAIIAFRKRRQIAERLRNWRQGYSADEASAPSA